MIQSIVFLPHNVNDAHRWVMACAQYCAMRRYEVVAVVHTWADAIKIIREGRATVLVTGRHDHLPPDRVPRVEIVTEQQHVTAVPPSRRRPVRRDRGHRPATKA